MAWHQSLHIVRHKIDRTQKRVDSGLQLRGCSSALTPSGLLFTGSFAKLARLWDLHKCSSRSHAGFTCSHAAMHCLHTKVLHLYYELQPQLCKQSYPAGRSSFEGCFGVMFALGERAGVGRGGGWGVGRGSNRQDIHAKSRQR